MTDKGDKKPEEEFDWTQALADWANTTFAPEPPERKRSGSPARVSRAPSMPDIDAALLGRPGQKAAPAPPAPKPLTPAPPPPDALADDPPVPEDRPSTKTLYRSSAAIRAAALSANERAKFQSSSTLRAADPVAPSSPPADAAAESSPGSVEAASVDTIADSREPVAQRAPSQPDEDSIRVSLDSDPGVNDPETIEPDSSEIEILSAARPMPAASPVEAEPVEPEPVELESGELQAEPVEMESIPEPLADVESARDLDEDGSFSFGDDPAQAEPESVELDAIGVAEPDAGDGGAIAIPPGDEMTVVGQQPDLAALKGPEPSTVGQVPKLSALDAPADEMTVVGQAPAAVAAIAAGKSDLDIADPKITRSTASSPPPSMGSRSAESVHMHGPRVSRIPDGGGSALGAVLGAEPSDDELDALLDGFPEDSEEDEQEQQRQAASAQHERPTSPPPMAPPPAANAFAAEEEEPTAVRDIAALMAGVQVGPSAKPVQTAPTAAAQPPEPDPLLDPDSITQMHAALPIPPEARREPPPSALPNFDDDITRTVFETPRGGFVVPTSRQEEQARSSAPAPAPSRPALPTPTPPPARIAAAPPAEKLPAVKPATPTSDAPPDSVTAMRLPTPAPVPVQRPAPRSSVKPAAEVAPPARRGLPSKPPTREEDVQVSASVVDVGELSELEFLGTAESFVAAEEVAAWGTERDAPAWFDEQSRDAFVARAEWLEDEARRSDDRNAKARGLLTVSELRAMIGQRALATSIAKDARDASPGLALPHRQIRGLMSSGDDGAAYLENIEQTLRATAGPTAKIHETLLAADTLRFAGDDEGARKRYEQAARLGAQDARLVVARAGLALAHDETNSIALRIPDVEGLSFFARAATAALRLRGIEVRGAAAESTANEPIRRARAALEKGDVLKAAAAFEELASDPTMKAGVTWLLASLYGVASDGTVKSIEALRKLADTRARRWIAARGLELGDPSIVAEALATDGVFSPAEQLVLQLLSGTSADDVRMVNSVVATIPEMAPLAAAAAGLRTPLDGHVAGDQVSRRETHLGRLLASEAAPHAIATAVGALAADRHEEMRALLLEIAHHGGRFGEIAERVSSWGDGAPERETRLAAALVAERGGDTGLARQAYRAVAAEDARSTLARRALASLDPEHDAAASLAKRAGALGSGPEAAAGFIELFLRLGSSDEGLAALQKAAAADPTLALPWFLLERAARNRGEVPQIVEALRGRRKLLTDPMEVALDGVREALLIAETEPETATELLVGAQKARPDDVALRELFERLTSVGAIDRAKWREARAMRSSGGARTLWLLEASGLYALGGDTEGALRAAQLAAGNSPQGFERLVLEDAELAAGSIARLSDELLAQAKAAKDSAERREAYERLAEVDAASDPASAMLWHRSVLEESPEHLPSLRTLEHTLVGESREDELEPILVSVAKRLVGGAGGEGVAHAAVASWLRARSGDLGSIHELAEIARRSPGPPLWALRAFNAHARATNDHQADYESAEALSGRTQRASERATLALRMGDAALRMGRQSDARRAYEQAVTIDADDVSAWEKLADARRVAQDFTGAAEALEACARTSRVKAYQLKCLTEAAELWLEQGRDEKRARTTLERAAEIDLTHGTVFSRLSTIYARNGAKAELARLLARRAEGITDENERLSVQVERGRLLSEIGEPAQARAALEAALAIHPDHTAALDAFADLSAQAGDHSAAEQAWVRLTRLLSAADEQRTVYAKLGALYADHLANPGRAELAFREVLKRAPDDVPTLERLVTLYSQQGDGPRALEAQNELVAKAQSPVQRRDRMIALSKIHETVAKDLRKAEQALETVRRELPQDVVPLRELAEFYKRHRQGPAIHMLLDRTASDVRRGLAAGRFAPVAFEIMSAIYELRGNEDAARLVSASLAAIEGRAAPLAGAEARAGDPKLDDLLAPEAASPPLRALLARSGEVLDVLAPVDLKALRASPLPNNHPLVALANALGKGMGLSNVQVTVSPQLGMMCVPISTSPAALVIGEPLVNTPLAAARGFLIVRALKLIQARAGALVRIPPKDAPAALGGYFRAYNPNWDPPRVPQQLVAEAARRLQPVVGKNPNPEVGILALEAAQLVFADPQGVAPALLSWANRTALLAVGDPNAALDALAWSSGLAGGAPASEARATWIGRTPDARDLLVFSLSDAYAEARARCGLKK